MQPADWIPEGIDVERPNAARIYDYWLGGSHNFAIDREVARQVTAVAPNTALIMQANRAFLHRAVRYLTELGIGQFLDIGSGIPTLGHVHEVAQRANPDARVVYVDIDPVAVAYSRHILAGNPRAIALQEDLRHPERILAHPDVRGLLNLDEPLAVLLLAVLHFIPDSDRPDEIIARLRDSVASGSYLAISHATADGVSDEVIQRTLELFKRTETPGYARNYAEVRALFAGYELVEPGVVWISQWRPEHPGDGDVLSQGLAAYAGVGLKR